jgi:nucleoid-associated protein YgaU
VETKPEKQVAPAPVASAPAAPEKQPPPVEEVKADPEVKQTESPAPALERPSPADVRAGPPDIQAEPAGQAIVVERGDTLAKLSSRVYGRSNERVLEIIRRNNPGLRDPDFILPGQKLFFPPIPDSQQ